MNKLFVFFIIAVSTQLCTNVVYGQTEVQSVTLQQGNKTTVFYGENAFVEAFNIVSSGTDIITLSSGRFVSPTLNKPVIIYGAGYEQDNKKNIYPTSITPLVMKYKNGKGDLDNITIEGCHIDNITVERSMDISHLTIKRCKIDNCNFDTSKLFYMQIINCVIPYLTIGNYAENSSIYNSIVIFGGNNRSTTTFIKNCIIVDTWDPIDGTFKDNIMLQDDFNNWTPSNYYANNIFQYPTLENLGYTNLYNNWFGKTDENIFGEVVGNTYNSTKLYTLSAEAALTFIGTDGTQVGLYGGFYPFTKTPSTPQIISKEINVKTTEDGKLKINIKVEAQK